MALTNSSFLLGAAIATVVALQVYQISYNLFISPLRHIPGPWYTKITGLPKFYNVVIRQRHAQWCHSLHQQYGPYVRVAPGEVLISDVQDFKKIHKIGTAFLKSPFYHYLNPTKAGSPPYGIFQETDPTKHANERRLFSKGFSQKSLRVEWEPVVFEKVLTAVQKMKQEARNNLAHPGQVDILKYWILMAGDTISELMFGESFNGLQTGKADPIQDAVDSNASASQLAFNQPLLYAIISRVPIKSLQEYCNTHKEIQKRGTKAAINARATSSNRNVFRTLLDKVDDDSIRLTDEEIIIQACTFIIGGTDTTANALTYLIWAVLAHPEVRKVVVEEAASLPPSFTDEQVEHLPMLNAVVKETLRLYGSAPGPLPRVTPKGGAEFGGYYFPEGTILATQAWTLHRDPDVFADPDRFDPPRWLSADFVNSDATKASFIPWGAGSRVCIGMHLASMELRLGAAVFFRECRNATLAPSTTDESMVPSNLFLISPQAKRCDVVIPA